MKRLLVVVCGALACSGCLLRAAMERQIGPSYDCKDVKVLEQRGDDARVDVCGDVMACRYDRKASSWVCDEEAAE